jgi:selenocysteine lyase/cysteine desulfurase
MARVGPVHYNTAQEIKRFGEELGEIGQALPNNVVQ